MNTTIQINTKMKTKLDRLKLYGGETYNEVIERLLEDISRINEDTRREIQQSLREIKTGKYKTHEQLGKEMGF
jgi:predicted transcriptional regulator